MTDISNPKSKNENFKNFFFKKDNNDIDENSYAFQKLVNLNKDKSMNEALNINNNFFNEINLKKKKTLEKSPDKEKFFLRDSKKYFNDDNNRKYSEYVKSNLKLNEQPNYKKIGHRSIKFGQYGKNNKEFLEYDGDKDSETLRKNNINNKKDINKINEQKNEKIKEIINKTRKINNKISIKNNSIINKSTTSYRQRKYKKENIEIIEPKSIKELKKNELINNYNTFCDGVIISGIKKPLKEKIIKESPDFLSPCGHKSCSLLYSIHSDILFFYYKNETLNLSQDNINKITKLSFPLGIKLCLVNKSDPKNIRNNPQQIFYNIIENDNKEKIY